MIYYCEKCGREFKRPQKLTECDGHGNVIRTEYLGCVCGAAFETLRKRKYTREDWYSDCEEERYAI